MGTLANVRKEGQHNPDAATGLSLYGRMARQSDRQETLSVVGCHQEMTQNIAATRRVSRTNVFTAQKESQFLRPVSRSSVFTPKLQIENSCSRR